jgi:tripartite-type tricarboxylate transporter receptor subunit TctC
MKKIIFAITTFLFLQYPAQAQLFKKPIYAHISVPAGGVHDIIDRVILNKLSQKIGQPIVIMNNPGASGIAAGHEVLEQPADGYNWYLTFAQFVITPYILPGKMNTSDFRGVAIMANTPMAVVSNPKYSSIDDLKKSTELYDGCTQLGSISCYMTGKFKSQLSLNSNRVMYDSSPQTLLDMVAGRLDWVISSINVLGSYKESSQLNVLATAQPNVYPNVKSLDELGYHGLNLLNWDGLLVRKETSDDIVNEIDRLLKEVLADPEVVDPLKKIGTDTLFMDSKEFDNEIKKELEFYSAQQ